MPIKMNLQSLLSLGAILSMIGCVNGFKVGSDVLGSAAESSLGSDTIKSQTAGETVFFNTMTALNLQASLPLKQERRLPSGLGTAHARPRYNPYGKIQTSFLDGAVDAYNLGFQTLKIWNGPEVKDSSFYFLSAEDRQKVLSSPKDALDVPAYKAVLAVPFKTVVFVADDEVLWNMASRPLTQDDETRVYKKTYDFAMALRERYRGTGRTFIIQNHEGDWHIDPTGKPDAANNPLPIGLENFARYWNARQKAINDARLAVASDVKVYHLCEVVRVRPSLERNEPSLTRDVLPQVGCDLVGYSSYESVLAPQGRETLNAVLGYIRSKAKPSAFFNSNQVVISEIGIPERQNFSAAQQSLVASIVNEQLRLGMPYVLFWTLYDNECTLPECSTYDQINNNVDISNLMGFYVRRPDRSLGNVFQQILSSLSSTPNAKVDWIRSLYVNGLGRDPDASGFAFWKNVAMNSGASCQSILRDFLGGSEFSARLNAGSASQAVQLGYLVVLKRSVSTTDAGYNYWLQLLTKNQINRSQFINYMIDSTETNIVCKSAGFP